MINEDSIKWNFYFAAKCITMTRETAVIEHPDK